MGFIGSKSWGNLDPPMLNQRADVEGCGHGAKGALHDSLAKCTATGLIWHIQQARGMLSKQTTIDYSGRVSKKL